jgi:peptidoglycan hydrolase-like protein with peptidoglycan-binding domain
LPSDETKSSRDVEIGEEYAMRVLILALSVLGILVGANAAKAGLSTTTRDPSASVDPVASVEPAASTDETTQITEDQIGLDREKRRDVQRWLTDLGFDAKVTGKFDLSTRAMITRWQAARGYPATGFLDTLQHEALLADVVAKARADAGNSGNPDADPTVHRHGVGVAHHHRGGGGPGGLIGGVVGGLFGR